MRIRLMSALVLIATSTPPEVAADPPGSIRGKAFLAGTDRPAARVTLHFLDRDQPRLSVVTDAGGRFLAARPAGVPLSEGEDGGQGPPCWMEAQDPGRWTWRPSPSGLSRRQPDYARKLIVEKLRRPAGTTWRRRGGIMNLEIQCPPTGDVEVLVRGADGAPTADRPVQVIPSEGTDALYGMGMQVPRFDGRTDAEGRFRIRWFGGMLRLKVAVPGVGFGSTGLIEVKPDQVARTQTPPLARFGSIEGRLDPKLVGPSMSIALELQGDAVAEAACDAEGRFALRDLLPDTYWLRPRRDGKDAGRQTRAVVAPGRTLAGVVIGPDRPSPSRGQVFQPFRRRPDDGKEVVWFEGTVRDEQGRGVAGVRVLGTANIDYGMRSFDRTVAATTDDRGRYQVRGPGARMGETSVMAHAEGRPPALCFAPKSGADGHPPVLDLTLPDARRGGSIRATVLQEGRPMAGANVELVPMDRPAPFARDFGDRNPEIAAARAVTCPSAITGPDGMARFDGLLPGRYALTAAEPGRAIPDRFRPNLIMGIARVGPEGEAAAPVFARAEGVDVAEGRETVFAVAVHPQPCAVRFRVFGPDGTPLAGTRTVDFRYGLGSPSTWTGMNLDDRGIGRYDFEWPGMWDVEVRFRDTGMGDSDLRSEPFYRAEALVPISPAMALDEPIRMVGLRRGLGSIRARLLDRDGRPARGTIVIGDNSFNRLDYGATTDDRGVVVFPDLPGGEYRVRGDIDGPEAPAPDPDLSQPSPDEAAIRGRSVVPAATVVVASGRESAVELRARRVGYVRGTLRPRPGHAASDYAISPAIDPGEVGSLLRLDPESGAFLHGPLLPGRVEYRFWLTDANGMWNASAGSQVVEVPAGDLAQVELRPDETGPATGPGGIWWPGEDIMRSLEKDPGTVVLDDGRTPAFAARSVLIVPRSNHPVGFGFSDTDGRLHWHGSFYRSSDEVDDPRKWIDRPTVVVWVPGRTGAAIVPVEAGRPFRATLPAPRGVEGRVTLGGRPIEGRNARVRVVAAHRGRGAALDEVLGDLATTQADGRFTIRGLTPGRYDVQAARDGIWLSRTIELTVADDRDPPPPAIEIPEPGKSVELHLVDREGRPAAGRPIGLVRPEGPLASSWPATLHAGPDGVLTLRGLEAGRHVLLIGEDRARREIVAPPANGYAGPPVVERIVVP